MKTKLSTAQHSFNALLIGLLAASPVMAANFDTLSQQTDGFSSLQQAAPPTESGVSHPPSVLESFQQAEQENKRSNYLEILNLVKKNKLDEAQTKLTNVLKNFPNEAEYYNLKALLDTLNKDLPAAQQSYEKAIKLSSKNILAHLGLAKIALDLGQIDKAKEYATKAIEINDKSVSVYLVLADIAFKQKDNAEVEKVLLTAQEKVQGNLTSEIEVIKNLGKHYNGQKQPEKILGLIEDLSKRYPNDTTVLNLLAQAQVINKQNPAAEQSLKKIVDLDKKDITNRLFLAKLLIEQADKEKEVMALLDEAAALNNENPEALVIKTAYLIKLKRSADALALASKIDQQFPKLIFGKLLKGDVYLADKQVDKAIEFYQQVYKAQPNDRILFILTDLLSSQKKEPEAMKLLETALSKDKKSLAINFKLASIYQQKNDTKRAEEHYQAMLAAQPENVLALNNLAFLYSQKNDPRALEMAKKAVEKAPEAAAILDTYGYILVKQNQAKEGLDVLVKAASLAPQANDIQFHLAEAYVANNDAKKAIEILEALGKVGQEFAEKKAAADLLVKLKAQ